MTLRLLSDFRRIFILSMACKHHILLPPFDFCFYVEFACRKCYYSLTINNPFRILPGSALKILREDKDRLAMVAKAEVILRKHEMAKRRLSETLHGLDKESATQHSISKEAEVKDSISKESAALFMPSPQGKGSHVNDKPAVHDEQVGSCVFILFLCFCVSYF